MLNNTSCEWVNELDTLGTMETIGISGTIRRGLEIWIGE